MKQTDQTMLNLAALRDNLNKLLDPKVLQKLVELSEAFGDNESDYLERYRFFILKNGEDCRYAHMAKEFFINDHGKSCAEAINALYHNWAKFYEEK